MAASRHDSGFWLAVFSLVGTTIGAGIFSLPYVFLKSGFIIGITEFIIIVGTVLLIQLAIGEIALRTGGEKRLVGYVSEYLGPKWKFLTSAFIISGSIGILLVYLILGGRFLSFISGGGVFTSSLIFFTFWFLSLLIQPKNFGKTELIFGFLIISIIVFILSFNVGYVNLNNFKGFDLNNLLLPYGVILFAVSGFYVIPEMKDIIKTEKRSLKKAIIYGTLIPAAVYLFFVFIVLGVSGTSTSEDAISGLAIALNSKSITLLGSILGLLAVFGASLSLGLYLKETFWYDFKLNKWLSWLAVGFSPLALFMLGARNLITTISIVGALFFAFQTVVILLIHKKSKLSAVKPEYEIKLPDFIYYLIGFTAVFGALLDVWYSLF